MSRTELITVCEYLNKKEQENPTPKTDVNFVLKPESGKLVLYKVQEYEREGLNWEVIEKES